MSNGNLYKATWEKQNNVFHLWLKDHPSIEAKHDSFKEAEESLVDAIFEQFGTEEIQVDFDPPSPIVVRQQPLEDPRFVIVGNENVLVGSIRPLENFFAGGICKGCKYPIGERNKCVIETRVLLRKKHAGLISGRYMAPVFSSAFLDLFSTALKKGIECRRLAHADLPPEDSNGFELIADTMPPFVRPEGSPGVIWKCDDCGRTEVDHLAVSDSPLISADDLNPSARMFLVGSLGRSFLVLSQDLWKAVKAEAPCRGVVSKSLGVLPTGTATRKHTITLKEHWGL